MSKQIVKKTTEQIEYSIAKFITKVNLQKLTNPKIYKKTYQDQLDELVNLAETDPAILKRIRQNNAEKERDRAKYEQEKENIEEDIKKKKTLERKNLENRKEHYKNKNYTEEEIEQRLNATIKQYLIKSDTSCYKGDPLAKQTSEYVLLVPYQGSYAAVNLHPTWYAYKPDMQHVNFDRLAATSNASTTGSFNERVSAMNEVMEHEHKMSIAKQRARKKEEDDLGGEDLRDASDDDMHLNPDVPRPKVKREHIRSNTNSYGVDLMENADKILSEQTQDVDAFPRVRKLNPVFEEEHDLKPKVVKRKKYQKRDEETNIRDKILSYYDRVSKNQPITRELILKKRNDIVSGCTDKRDELRKKKLFKKILREDFVRRNGIYHKKK